MRKWLLIFGIAIALEAEVIDRIAVSVGGEIITQQQVLLYLRSAALINGGPVKETAADQKRAAQKLIELALIRIEMQTSRYPMPSDAQVKEALDALKKQRFAGKQAAYEDELKAKQIQEYDVLDSLRWQLAILSFIEFRFRPGVQISEEELRDFYQYDYKKEFPGRVNDRFNQARPVILELLTQQRIDNLLDQWLSESEASTKVRWLENSK